MPSADATKNQKRCGAWECASEVAQRLRHPGVTPVTRLRHPRGEGSVKFLSLLPNILFLLINVAIVR